MSSRARLPVGATYTVAMEEMPASSDDPAHSAAGVRSLAGAHERNPRGALRDPMLVERILDRHGVRPSLRPILDAPCGVGRLRGVLERRGLRYVGLDASSALLRQASGRAAAAGEVADPSGLCLGAVDRLPFRDDSFEVVVCCRLLHHVDDEETVNAIVHEITRVAHKLVIASFFDAASLPALRRRVGLRRSEGPRGKHALSKRSLRRMFEAAGAEVIGFHHSLRFVAQQAFVVAQKRAPADERARGMQSLQARFTDLEVARVSGSLGQA
jgi:SAM-dependent methyltransferase